MARPFKEGATWAFRLRIQGEDIYRRGFETEALARSAANTLRHTLKNRGKPAHQGPWKTTFGGALHLYAQERLPALKGGVQEASRINRFLRLAGLPVLKLSAVEGREEKSEKSTVHFQVSLVSSKGPRKIAQGLASHREKQAQRAQRSDALRKRLAEQPVAEITAYQIQALIDLSCSEGMSAATIRLEHAMLRQFFNHALHTWSWPCDGGNPALRRKLPKVDNARSRVLTNKEWSEIEAALDETKNPYVSLALELLLETAMRCSEALVQARWRDFDEAGCTLTLTTAKAGGREVPMGPGALGVMRALRLLAEEFGPVSPSCPVFHLSYEALRAAWKRVCDRAKVQGVKLHDLRHTSATRYALELQGDLPVLQLITGHKTMSQLMRYINLNASDAARILNGRPICHDDAPAGLRAVRAGPTRPLQGAPCAHPSDLPVNVLPMRRPNAAH